MDRFRRVIIGKGRIKALQKRKSVLDEFQTSLVLISLTLITSERLTLRFSMLYTCTPDENAMMTVL